MNRRGRSFLPVGLAFAVIGLVGLANGESAQGAFLAAGAVLLVLAFVTRRQGGRTVGDARGEG